MKAAPAEAPGTWGGGWLRRVEAVVLTAAAHNSYCVCNMRAYAVGVVVVKHEGTLRTLPRGDRRVEDGGGDLEPGGHVPDQTIQPRRLRPPQDLVGHRSRGQHRRWI